MDSVRCRSRSPRTNVKIIVISMNNEIGHKRRSKILYNYDYVINGDTYENVPETIKTKMKTYWNCSEKKRRNRICVFHTHLKTLQFIIDNNINNVIVCEDDVFKMHKFDTLPEDICLLSGILAEPRRWKDNKKWVNEKAEQILQTFKK